MDDKPKYKVKEPKNLSPRIKWLRDYYFKGVERNWNNEFLSFTTGTSWDVQYDETTYYIVPETYSFFQTFGSSFRQSAIPVKLPENFFSKSLPERRALFIKEVMTNYVPVEILPGDLLAGARFNIMASRCLTESESKKRDSILYGKDGAREKTKYYHDHGYGNCGATSGHIIPDHEKALKVGFKGIYKEIEDKFNSLSENDKKGKKGNQLKAMMISAKMPKELSEKYADLIRHSINEEKDETRKKELIEMERITRKVPWEPADNFWEAIQSLWMTHMLVMTDENYPGPGVSFGRIDQYLNPYWEKSLKEGMDREFGLEILKCFFIHCNTAYDAMIRVGGNQGITAGYGQLFNLSGMGQNGDDITNDLTYAFLEVIDDMSPILEPKPNVRLNRNTPDKLLDKVVDMISESQGAPFLLNFDERSMAGLLREAKMAGCESYINKGNVYNYASVGCLENTMAGNDRSGTVDNNINLLKAVEFALNDGCDLVPYSDELTGKDYPVKSEGVKTGEPESFKTFDEFFKAFEEQIKFIIQKDVDLYEITESTRARYCPTPYLSCLVKGCIDKCMDVTEGGPELKFTTIEGVTFATTVDSLLAVKYLVYDKKECTMNELIRALKDNWEGHEVLEAKAKNKAPKYGRDDTKADEMARRIMDLWTNEVWKHKTKSTGRQFRPGMLSWNYWVGDGYILPASPDGRKKGQFLSNAICPSNGADTNGPTANTNSVGNALGGKTTAEGDFEGYLCSLPNGASHTITFSPSLLRDPEHKEKFKAFLRGYCENGGTALQINMLDSDMLRDAQAHPENYKNLLVRVTGYNAYFTSIGRELQDEIIARESHNKF
jgi:pyruvate-formate lyase